MKVLRHLTLSLVDEQLLAFEKLTFLEYHEEGCPCKASLSIFFVLP